MNKIKIDKSQKSSKFLKASVIGTAIAILGCLSIHLLVIAGIATVTATLGHVEHALLFISIALIGLTVFAFIRHRRSSACYKDN